MGDVIRDRIDHRIDVVRRFEQNTAVARVLKEPVGAPVRLHFDKADMIDKQTRPRPGRDGDVKNIASFGRLGENRSQRLAQQFEPADLGEPHFGDGGGMLRALGASAPQGGSERRYPGRTGGPIRRL